MRRLRQLALVVGSLAISGGLALGQARLGPYVVDSNGLKVGHAVDPTDAIIFVGGEPALIALSRLGFSPTGFTVYFSDNSCSGPQLINVGNNSRLYAPGYYTSDGVIHYVSMASAKMQGTQSSMSVNFNGTLGGCNVGSSVTAFAPALTAPAPALATPLLVVDVLLPSPAPPVATFNDVQTNHPFFQFIEALVASGITAGCNTSPPLYCPDKPVTRGQIAVFLAKALGL